MNQSPKSAHERYLFKPFPCSSHSWVIGELQQLPKEATVLDVGPGSGAIGQTLKSQIGITELSAIEIDPDTIRLLEEQQIYREIVRDLEHLSQKEFDCILLLDLLEHLVDPFSFLQQVATLLKPGGMIYISVPNIAHWSMRLSLLAGYFEYTERGLLDKTHLQFFNRRRFIRLCNSLSDCSLTATSQSLEPVEFLFPNWVSESALFQWLRNLQQALSNWLPGLLAYQHLGSIKKNL